jgi:hypothetical protein
MLSFSEPFPDLRPAIQNAWRKVCALTKSPDAFMGLLEPQTGASAFNPMNSKHSPEEEMAHMAAIPRQGAFIHPHTPKHGPDAYKPGGSLLCAILGR